MLEKCNSTTKLGRYAFWGMMCGGDKTQTGKNARIQNSENRKLKQQVEHRNVVTCKKPTITTHYSWNHRKKEKIADNKDTLR